MHNHFVREINYDPVFDAQRHYRIMLDCMARPGKLNSLDDVAIDPPMDWSIAATLVGFTLLNADVSVHFLPDEAEMKHYMVHHTSVLKNSLDQADFVFLKGNSAVDLEMIKTGALEFPEEGATLVIQLKNLSRDSILNAPGIRLNGPGVEQPVDIYLEGIPTGILKQLQGINEGYPIGLDCFFVDEQNQLMGLPRSNKFTILE